jgi:tRNA(Arg) A34 adenosine deaminase TadA
MLDETAKLLRDPAAELVFGLVAPVGADLDQLQAALVDQLGLYGYHANPIRLSELLKKVRGLGVTLKDAPELERVRSYMDAGNALRKRTKSEEILALWAMAKIKEKREAAEPVLRRTAHILRSIKHPDEARALRAVYGPGFLLVGLSAAKALRLKADDIPKIRKACEGTRLLDITEFGRAVHAEMDAISSCDRAGVSTLGTTLFSTTFPCHNCAKHIVTAGVHRVVYIEPYEKSQALDLHDDAITIRDDGDTLGRGDGIDEADHLARKVVFEPFMGIGPRRFFDLFSMRLSNGFPMKRKDKPDGKKAKWKISSDALVRVPMPPTSYLDRETQLAQLVTKLLEEKNREDQDSHRRSRNPRRVGGRAARKTGGRRLASVEARRSARS